MRVMVLVKATPDSEAGVLPGTELLEAMAQAKVDRAVCICTTLEEFEAVHALALAHPQLWATVGVHPDNEDVHEPTVDELVAHGRSVEEVRQIIGADALIYQDVDAMKQAVGSLNDKLNGFDASCFDGVYVTGDIQAEDIERMNASRVKTGEDEVDTSRLALPNHQGD